MPVSVSVPSPYLISEPVPEISLPKVKLSERLNVRRPLLTMLPPTMPVMPPLPICRVADCPIVVVPVPLASPATTSVPAFTDVLPVKVFAPVSVRMPAPSFVSVPLPEITT